MKHINKIKKTIFLLLVFAIVLNGCKKSDATDNGKSDTEKNEKAEDVEQKEITPDEVGYASGVLIAKTLKANDVTANPAKLAEGFKAALADSFTDEDTKKAEMNLQQAFLQAHKRKVAKNLEKSNKFLEENAKRQGVKTTSTGLQYEILQEGKDSGHPVATDNVMVNYKGTLTDGTVFDEQSSKEPMEINLAHVIPAWTEALQLMTRGSKFKLFVPPALGYGESGAKDYRGAELIPGNVVLIFEIELVDFKPKKEVKK